MRPGERSYNPRSHLTWLGLCLAMACGCGGSASDYAGLLEGPETNGRPAELMRVRWTEMLSSYHAGPYLPVEQSVATLDEEHGRIYVGASSGDLWCLTLEGGFLYRYAADASIHTRAALDTDADELYVGTEDGTIHALRATNGAKRWSAEAGGPVAHAPLLIHDAVYVVTSTDDVVALSRKDGELLWRFQRNPPAGFAVTGHAGLLHSQGRLVTGFTDGTVVALDPGDGRVIWERDTSLDVDPPGGGAPRFTDVDTTPIQIGEWIYVASFTGGLYALDPSNGAVQWRNAALTGIASMTWSGRDLVLASAHHGIVAFDPAAQRVRWRRPVQRGAPGTPSVADGVVMVGESEGAFLLLSLRDGHELARLESAFGFSAAASVHGRRGFVLSNGGMFFAFAP